MFQFNFINETLKNSFVKNCIEAEKIYFDGIYVGKYVSEINYEKDDQSLDYSVYYNTQDRKLIIAINKDKNVDSDTEYKFLLFFQNEKLIGYVNFPVPLNKVTKKIFVEIPNFDINYACPKITAPHCGYSVNTLNLFVKNISSLQFPSKILDYEVYLLDNDGNILLDDIKDKIDISKTYDSLFLLNKTDDEIKVKIATVYITLPENTSQTYNNSKCLIYKQTYGISDIHVKYKIPAYAMFYNLDNAYEITFEDYPVEEEHNVERFSNFIVFKEYGSYIITKEINLVDKDGKNATKTFICYTPEKSKLDIKIIDTETNKEIPFENDVINLKLNKIKIKVISKSSGEILSGLAVLFSTSED